jgi:phage terminase large subunit
MILTVKQTIALDYLQDDTTTELCFGGGAGGGKSALACYYLLKGCFKYPQSRWLMGRAKLKTLKETTLKTFFEVVQMQGLTTKDFRYNDQSHRITIRNKSEIFLKDLFFYPADPDFDELGSLELTGAIIDEASQVTLKAKNIVKSRIRYKLDEFDLLPKMLLTTNPTRGWIFDQFYKPNNEDTLPEHRKYIQSLYYDNPYLSESYETTLDSLDPISRKRLKLGDWDYLDDPSMLIDYDSVNDLFTNDHILKDGNKRLSADLAMQGRDKFIVTFMDGGILTIVCEKAKSTGRDIETTLKGLMLQFGVGNSNVVADSDGMGNYLESYILNIKTFHGNAKPGNPEFNNLKSECAFKLAELINKRLIKIECTFEQMEEIKRQLLNCLKRDNIDADDGKKKLINKEKMKELLGISPDYFDSLLMQMVFYLRKEYF